MEMLTEEQISLAALLLGFVVGGLVSGTEILMSLYAPFRRKWDAATTEWRQGFNLLIVVAVSAIVSVYAFWELKYPWEAVLLNAVLILSATAGGNAVLYSTVGKLLKSFARKEDSPEG